MTVGGSVAAFAALLAINFAVSAIAGQAVGPSIDGGPRAAPAATREHDRPHRWLRSHARP